MRVCTQILLKSEEIQHIRTRMGWIKSSLSTFYITILQFFPRINLRMQSWSLEFIFLKKCIGEVLIWCCGIKKGREKKNLWGSLMLENSHATILTRYPCVLYLTSLQTDKSILNLLKNETSYIHLMLKQNKKKPNSRQTGDPFQRNAR